jgi:phasin family protein
VSASVILETGEAAKTPASHAASAINDLTGLTAVWIEAVARLAELNNRAIHTTLAEQQAIALQAAEEHSLLGAWRLQSSYSLAGTAKAAAYLRHVGDILLGAYADAVNEAETSFNRSFMAITGMADNASARASSAVLDLGPDLAARPDRTARIVNEKGDVVSSRD